MYSFKAIKIESGLKSLPMHVTAKIYSVYQSVCNIILQDRLVAMVVKDFELSPDIIVIDTESPFTDFDLKTGESVSINLSGAECFEASLDKSIKGQIFDKIKCKDHQNESSRAVFARYNFRLNYISRLTKTYGVSSPLYKAFFCCEVNPEGMVKLFSEQLGEITKFAEKGMVYETADSASKVCGLGIGLTPSGDDFIAGMLLSFSVTGNSGEQIKRVAESCSDKTLLISAQMIANAAQGRARLSELDFLKAFFLGEKEDIKQLFYKVLSFGSSSGTDTMIGIIVGLRCLTSFEIKRSTYDE